MTFTLRVHNLVVTSPYYYLQNIKKVASRSQIGTIKIAWVLKFQGEHSTKIWEESTKIWEKSTKIWEICHQTRRPKASDRQISRQIVRKSDVRSSDSDVRSSDFPSDRQEIWRQIVRLWCQIVRFPIRSSGNLTSDRLGHAKILFPFVDTKKKGRVESAFTPFHTSFNTHFFRARKNRGKNSRRASAGKILGVHRSTIPAPLLSLCMHTYIYITYIIKSPDPRQHQRRHATRRRPRRSYANSQLYCQNQNKYRRT